MIEKIRKAMQEIESCLTEEADNANDAQCDDMTLNHLMIAKEWQKRKVKKAPVMQMEDYLL